MGRFSVPQLGQFGQISPQIAWLEVEIGEDCRSRLAAVTPATETVVIAVRGGELAWMPRKVSRAEETLDAAVAGIRERGMRAAFCPQATGFPSDVPSTLTLLRSRRSEDLSLVIEPAMLLTESLLPTAREHIVRIREALVIHPQTVGIVESNAVWEHGQAVRMRVSAGALPPELVEVDQTSLAAGVWVACIEADRD